MCDTPPISLNVSEAIDINISEKDDTNLLEEQSVLAIETNSNESNSAEVSSSSYCPIANDRTTRNSTKVAAIPTRFTRSRDNPEFVAKQKNFMAQVQAANLGHESPVSWQEPTVKRKRDSVNSPQPRAKKKKLTKLDSSNNGELQNDNCCWECHREGQFICCEMCPRVFHLKCLGMEKEPDDDWACQECHSIMLAENVENRSRAMQLISVDQLCTLLKFALTRLNSSPALSPFCNPVDTTEFPSYRDVILHPLDLQTLEKNIKKKFYGSTEAFLADARWIYHNSVIFNGANSKVTSLAKNLLKILRQELSEIETCPDCYQNAHLKPDSWFTEACRLAHPLVWAKLKGFPYWPAKAVKWKEGNVDVRFFGRHDRSWVQLKDCFLYSMQMPTPLKNRNKTLETCLIEVKKHIDSLKERFGEFIYAPHRTPYNPHDTGQIKLLLPLYKGPTILKIKPSLRTPSRTSQSGTDDDASSVTSSDSYSVYSKKLNLLEYSILQSSDSQMNQEESESKMDDADDEAESDKCDLDCDSTLDFKITNIQSVELSNFDKYNEITKKTNDKDKLEGVDDVENKITLEKEQDPVNKLNADKTDLTSKQLDADLKSPEEKDNISERNFTATDNSSIKNSISDLKVKDVNDESVSVPHMSIKQAVEGDSILLDDELGIKANPKKAILTSDSIQDNKIAIEEKNGSLPVKKQIVDDAHTNESVLKFQCINALLNSSNSELSKPKVGSESTAQLNEEKTSNEDDSVLEFGLEDAAKDDITIAKSTSTHSSVDEDSFQGFFSEDSTIEKSESCKNVLKRFRKSLLQNDDDNEMENELDVVKSPRKDITEDSSVIVAKVDSSNSTVIPPEDDTNSQKELPPIPDISKSVDTEDQPVEQVDSDGTDSIIEEEEVDPLRICESPPPIDIKSYASKIFHNVTVKAATPKKSGKNVSRNSSTDNEAGNIVKSARKSLKSSDSAAEDTTSDTLLTAVRLVQNIGNTAIRRLDSKTLEHTSGNDKITISIAENTAVKTSVSKASYERAAPKSVKEARKAFKSSSQVKNQLAAMGSSVSLAKASESKKEEKAKVLSGIDTTRLSPSISIIPVSTAASIDKNKVRCVSTVSIPSASPGITSSFSVKCGSPLISTAERTTPNSNVSPSIPPPLLSHAMASPAGTIRGMLGGHLPQLQGFQNTQIRTTMPSPAMRLIGPNPAILMANRMPAGVLRPSPPEAGPLSAELGKHSLKLAEMMRSSLEEVIGGLVGMGSPEARLAALQLELERCNWRHQQELADVRHNADVMLVEMRASLEAEKQRAVEEARKQVEQKLTEVRHQANDRISDIRKQCETDKHREVEETKKKQWCANCHKEALLFCCWNTSYCDYPCQQNHWPQHMSVCGQNSGSGLTLGGDGEVDATNGDMSGPSSGVSTPVHSTLAAHLMEDEDGLSSEERKRKKRRENPSPIFTDPLAIEPLQGNLINCSQGLNSSISLNKPMVSIGPGVIRPPMTSPGMPLRILGPSTPIGMHMKVPRFLQHSLMQPQQTMFGAMDPRMVMMIGRGMGNPAMMRGHLQPFRPRFM